MRRIVPLALALALIGVASCDPTGNTDFSSAAANVRLVNLVTDVPALNLSADGVGIATGILFGVPSSYRSLRVNDSILVFTRQNDAAAVATDTVALVDDRRYTYYAIGAIADFRPRLVIDDTIFAAPGNFKVRIVNALGTHAASDLDFYASLPSDSLADILPTMASLGYGAASPYFATATTFRRFRLTLAGQTTAIFDTTLATAIADSSVVTLVASDKPGGGTPFRFLVLTDKAP